ncbi:glycosyltransferase family 25 protein [Parvibaculum sp.]|uniref:glycosyltransferase family 25 protein n=1 Tax=Parvibaculum sp. TaxID=2024848 RepID=UPI002C2DA439|nr:glycosyltransferase family 25 protein [Parvibaculum sp.]HUD51350.1 glycosyltransferase family 25 protein [Parvibaculum sp.]
MDVYVINLDSQPQRLAAMRARLPALHRIAAINGWALPPDQLTKGHHYPEGYDLSPPEVGCAMSHRKAWDEFLRSGRSHGCFLEDDVVLSADFTSVVSNASWVPGDADIVKIETTQLGVFLDRVPAAHVGAHALHRLRFRHMGAAGYILSRAGAEKLLALSLPFRYPVDVLMFDHRIPEFAKLTTYQMTPALCCQPQNTGMVQTDSGINAHRGRKPKRTPMRGLTRRLQDLKWFTLQRPFLRAATVPFG